MYKFSPNLYIDLSNRFLEELSSLSLYSGVIEFEYDSVEIRFVATILPYHHTESDDKSERYVIHDLVPIWWEMHTTTSQSEVINDFDFNIFKEYICQ